MNKQSGVLIVLSGPSGVGKGLLRKLISAEIPWLKESVSATTREKRPGEVDGLDYFFVSHDEFRKMIDADQLIEWAEFASNFYGTPKRFVQETLEKGDSILL
jgi:guanylate kinase